MQKQQCEYINIKENIIFETCPSVAGLVYHTSDISEIFHIIMEPSLAMISHIAKDSFDFKNRLDKHCRTGTTFSACDIKSLHTNILHDLFYTAVKHWIEKLKNDLPLWRRVNKKFIREGLSIILEFSYFFISGIYIYQILKTTVGIKFTVVDSNLVVAYKGVKMFALLLQLYPQDIVDFFVLN